MRAIGILSAVLAAGVLLIAPGFDGARADQYQRQGQNQHQSYNGNGYGYGWWGQQQYGNHRDGGYAYGKRARNDYGSLTHGDRQRLFKIRQRFDSERDFRRFLRNHQPGLFSRYMDQPGHRHHVFGHRRPQPWVWYHGQNR
jgi:hypothetical protein